MIGGLDTIIAFGNTEPLLMEQKIRRTRDGLDTAQLRVLSSSQYDYQTGNAAPFIAGMEIVDVDSEQDGKDWIHDIRAVGIIENKKLPRREQGFPKIRRTLEGWDEGSDSWIIKTESLSLFAAGASMVGYSTLFVTDALVEPLLGEYFRVQASYRGVASSKQVKRVIRTNEQIVSPSEPIVVDLPGGWSDTRRSQVSLPKITVTDTYVTQSSAPTASIPGNATPANPPSVASISISGDLTWMWPNQWKLADVSADELGSTGWRLLSLTYEFVFPAVY